MYSRALFVDIARANVHSLPLDLQDFCKASQDTRPKNPQRDHDGHDQLNHLRYRTPFQPAALTGHPAAHAGTSRIKFK